jgi:hypothetical protein
MRRTDQATGLLFSYVDLEERIPLRHPLRKIRQVVNDALSMPRSTGSMPPRAAPRSRRSG